MDADSNPASRMNYLQQNQFENRSLFGCRRQRDKTLNKVSNLGHGFIQKKLEVTTINQGNTTFEAKAQLQTHAPASLAPTEIPLTSVQREALLSSLW